MPEVVLCFQISHRNDSLEMRSENFGLFRQYLNNKILLSIVYLLIRNTFGTVNNVYVHHFTILICITYLFRNAFMSREILRLNGHAHSSKKYSSRRFVSRWKTWKTSRLLPKLRWKVGTFLNLKTAITNSPYFSYI